MSEEETFEERKEEEIEEALEELGEALKEEADESKKDAILSRPSKDTVAILFDNPVVEQKLQQLREATEFGIESTQKNVVVFYKHATEAGDRFRGLLFLLLGLSIAVTSLFVTGGQLVTIKEVLSILVATQIGRMVAAFVGVSLMAYGSNKMLRGLMPHVKKAIFGEEKPKYVQKRLVEE